MTRLVPALLSIGAGAAMLVACDSSDQDRADYFTIQIVPGNEEPGPNAGTYNYIPVTGTSYNADPRFTPCGAVQVDFTGIALASAGGEGSRVSDNAEQESGTAARYVGNPDFSTCSTTANETFEAEFTYRGARYVVQGLVILPFGNYSTIVPGTNWADTCSQYAHSLIETETTGSVACFWPYEFGPPASATAY